MKFLTVLLTIILLNTNCFAQYVLFRDTLPANRTILMAESNTELYFDIFRTFSSDFIMTYKPGLAAFDKNFKLAVTGGILNNKLALGVEGTGTIIGRYNEERFGMQTTEGIEARVGFIMTSGKTEMYVIPGVFYTFHVYGWLRKYVIVSPGFSLWLGTTSYPVISLNIGVGL